MRQIPLTECRFVFSKSGGPGGQKVNKTSSRVTLLWRAQDSAALSEAEKQRLVEKLCGHLNSDGDVALHCDTERSQAHNREQVYERLQSIVARALYRPKKRVRSKVPRAAKERRLQTKRRRSARLSGRRMRDE